MLSGGDLGLHVALHRSLPKPLEALGAVEEQNGWGRRSGKKRFLWMVFWGGGLVMRVEES